MTKELKNIERIDGSTIESNLIERQLGFESPGDGLSQEHYKLKYKTRNGQVISFVPEGGEATYSKVNLTTVEDDNDAATKKYVDDKFEESNITTVRPHLTGFVSPDDVDLHFDVPNHQLFLKSKLGKSELQYYINGKLYTLKTRVDQVLDNSVVGHFYAFLNANGQIEYSQTWNDTLLPLMSGFRVSNNLGEDHTTAGDINNEYLSLVAMYNGTAMDRATREYQECNVGTWIEAGCSVTIAENKATFGRSAGTLVHGDIATDLIGNDSVKPAIGYLADSLTAKYTIKPSSNNWLTEHGSSVHGSLYQGATKTERAPLGEGVWYLYFARPDMRSNEWSDIVIPVEGHATFANRYKGIDAIVRKVASKFIDFIGEWKVMGLLFLQNDAIADFIDLAAFQVKDLLYCGMLERTLTTIEDDQNLSEVLARGNDAGGKDIVGVGKIGIGTDSPEVKNHIKSRELGIDWKGNYSHLAIEATDAHLDLVSSEDGTWGSAIHLKQVDSKTKQLDDSWSIVRKTSINGNGDGSLRISNGTNKDGFTGDHTIFYTDGTVELPKSNTEKIENSGPKAVTTKEWVEQCEVSAAKTLKIPTVGGLNSTINKLVIANGTSAGNAEALKVVGVGTGNADIIVKGVAELTVYNHTGVSGSLKAGCSVYRDPSAYNCGMVNSSTPAAIDNILNTPFIGTVIEDSVLINNGAFGIVKVLVDLQKVVEQDFATKDYVDDKVANITETQGLSDVLSKGDDAGGQKIKNIGNGLENGDAVNKGQLDTTVGEYLKRDGTLPMTGDLNLGNKDIDNVNDITTDNIDVGIVAQAGNVIVKEGGTIASNGTGGRGSFSGNMTNWDTYDGANIFIEPDNNNIILRTNNGTSSTSTLIVNNDNSGLRYNHVESGNSFVADSAGVRCSNTISQINLMGGGAITTKDYVDDKVANITETQGLSDVLSKGNDAGGQDVVNVKHLAVNDTTTDGTSLKIKNTNGGSHYIDNGQLSVNRNPLTGAKPDSSVGMNVIVQGVTAAGGRTTLYGSEGATASLKELTTFAENGIQTLPSSLIENIDAVGNKAVTTKEYVESRLINPSGRLPKTVLQKGQEYFIAYAKGGDSTGDYQIYSGDIDITFSLEASGHHNQINLKVTKVLDQFVAKVTNQIWHGGNHCLGNIKIYKAPYPTWHGGMAISITPASSTALTSTIVFEGVYTTTKKDLWNGIVPTTTLPADASSAIELAMNLPAKSGYTIFNSIGSKLSGDTSRIGHMIDHMGNVRRSDKDWHHPKRVVEVSTRTNLFDAGDGALWHSSNAYIASNNAWKAYENGYCSLISQSPVDGATNIYSTTSQYGKDTDITAWKLNFRVDRNGIATLPHADVGEIEAAENKALTTKEYVDTKVANITETQGLSDVLSRGNDANGQDIINIGAITGRNEIKMTNESSFAGAAFISSPTSFSYVNLGDTDDANIGQISYHHTDDSMRFTTNNILQMKLDSIGIQTLPQSTVTNISTAGDKAVTTKEYNDANYYRAKHANSYWGLETPTGDGDWIRTTQLGLIPYQAGGASTVGTPSWPFNQVHSKTIFENGVTLSKRYAGVSPFDANSCSVNLGSNSISNSTITAPKTITGAPISVNRTSVNETIMLQIPDVEDVAQRTIYIDSIGKMKGAFPGQETIINLQRTGSSTKRVQLYVKEVINNTNDLLKVTLDECIDLFWERCSDNVLFMTNVNATNQQEWWSRKEIVSKEWVNGQHALVTSATPVILGDKVKKVSIIHSGAANFDVTLPNAATHEYGRITIMSPQTSGSGTTLRGFIHGQSDVNYFPGGQRATWELVAARTGYGTNDYSWTFVSRYEGF